MEKYHKYVFDIDARKFVGKFKEMYQNESKEVFDSWHQEDSRQLQRRIVLLMLNGYNLDTIVDLGCGKGTLTHLLKKKNNSVTGIDVSQTALNIAKARYPDIDFAQLDMKGPDNLKNFFKSLPKQGMVDMVFTSEMFSYLENWRGLLNVISEHTKYFLICLYIPEDPIGFVKSENDLVCECEKYFDVIEWVTLHQEKFTIFFGESKKG